MLKLVKLLRYFAKDNDKNIKSAPKMLKKELNNTAYLKDITVFKTVRCL